MRRQRRLFSQVIDPASLDRAIRLASRGKHRRPDVAMFLFRVEEQAAEIRARLADGRWRPVPADHIRIRDPKPRVITRAPFADRVVHTAVVEAMKPALLRSLRPECMACLEGRGTHRAVLRLVELRRRHRYALHLDVRRYFPSVDLGILRTLLARRIDDPPFLALVDHILDAGALRSDSPAVRWLDLDLPDRPVGLPVGAYTSQVLASWLYLDAFDHFVTRTLRPGGYVRYVDDLFFFADDRGHLRRIRREAAAWLLDLRHLRLKWPDAPVLSCRERLHALGYAIDDAGPAPLPRTLRRLRQRGRRFVFREGLDRAALARSLAATLGLYLP